MKTQGSPGGSPPCPIYLSLPQEIQPTALNYIDGYRSERLPANMLQAQRDYFGAHSYEKVDMSRLEFSMPTGLPGGDAASSTYEV